MTNFRTPIQIEAQNDSITYQDKIMMLGSCFSENIGTKLNDYKFDALSNPFGILYNPESIAESLDTIIDQKVFTEDDLFKHEGVWHSFAHHSRFSNADQTLMLKTINEHITAAHQHLKQCKYLILTFGTSWVFEHIENKQVVANCHKLPSKTFQRYRLSLSAILDRYQHLLERLRVTNPQLKLIVTVSPIRHLKDGFQENQLSKSTLTLACHQITNMLDDCHYFPSYEIMMDDLRDYRFYEGDMVHPSDLAIDYIWEQFCNAWVNTSAQKEFKSIEKISSASKHRPFNPKTEVHQGFIKKQLELIKQLEQKNPALNFSEEKEIFTEQLI